MVPFKMVTEWTTKESFGNDLMKVDIFQGIIIFSWLHKEPRLLQTAHFGNGTTVFFRFLQNTNLHKTDYNSRTIKDFDIL